MQLYKAKLDGVITRKAKDPTINKKDEVVRFIKKGELILVTDVESVTDKNLSLSYNKYTLWNGNYAISVAPPIAEQLAYSKASFVDIPEHLFVQIKKPKVYITIGILLLGLATYSVIKEQKNN
jgi:hypothetical protein